MVTHLLEGSNAAVDGMTEPRRGITPAIRADAEQQSLDRALGTGNVEGIVALKSLPSCIEGFVRTGPGGGGHPSAGSVLRKASC
jgi:hypothetical protein